MNFFSECLAIFESCENHDIQFASGAGLKGQSNSEAISFLVALGYLDRDVESDRLCRACVDATTVDNRLALLKLATQFVRSFQLPMQHAPGAYFFGAQLSHRVVGVERHGTATVGVAGRGLTLGQAFESCVGEAAEYLSIQEPDKGAVQQDSSNSAGPKLRKPQSNWQAHCDADVRWALRGVGVDHAASLSEVDWIDATSLVDVQTKAFPVELCWRRAPNARKLPRQAETNGCAAGPTLADATLEALEEVVERDAIALWWFGGEGARVLPSDLLDELEISSLMAALRGDTRRQHWFIDLTTEFGIPVIGALSAEPNGDSIIAGFDAGLNLQKTIIGAALEMCQMELAQELSLLKREQDGEKALSELDRLWIDRRERLHVRSFPQLHPSRISELRPTSTERDYLSECLERLGRSGFEPYRFDLSQEEIGIPVVRIIIPGLQSAKPDWQTPRLAAISALNGRPLYTNQELLSPI